LSSTSLVHRAFFSPEYPVGEVKKFEVLMPEYESLVWPLGMMFSFVNVGNVLKSVVGWRDERQARVLIIAGEKDTLMGVGLMRKMAADYRQQFISFAKSLWGARFKETEETKPESSDDKGSGLRLFKVRAIISRTICIGKSVLRRFWHLLINFDFFLLAVTRFP
jgi:hypothetical protein